MVNLTAGIDSSPLATFRCERRALELTKAGCTRLFISANGPRPPDPWEGRAACRNCPVGSMHHTGHAPDPIIALKLHLKPLCVRCGRHADRLIWNTFCPSCDARQREAVKGKNAKGNPPAIRAILHTESVFFAVGLVSKIITKPMVISLPEIMLQAAKSAAGPAVFARRRVTWPALTRLGPGKPWTTQLELGL